MRDGAAYNGVKALELKAAFENKIDLPSRIDEIIRHRGITQEEPARMKGGIFEGSNGDPAAGPYSPSIRLRKFLQLNGIR